MVVTRPHLECLHVNDMPAGVLHHIFDFLGPRDLCCVSITCKYWAALNKDAAANQVWKAFYSRMWAAPDFPDEQQQSWQQRYGCKRSQVRAYGGKSQLDCLYGHKAGTRCLALLPSRNLLATGSLDKTVRVWDLTAGMPLTTSRLHQGTVRAITMDADLLVSGSSQEGGLRVWRASESNLRSRFDLAQQPLKLQGHTGPITSLALDTECLYSGSWDYTVRMWWRSSLKCASTLSYDDWVWGVCPRAEHLLVSAGSSAYVHDIRTGASLRRFVSPSTEFMSSSRLEGTRDGRLLICGAGDGSISAYDLRSSKETPASILWQGPSAISSISFEDPWVAATLLDGTLLLLNAEQSIRSGKRGPVAPATLASRARQFPGQGGSAYCVQLADQWMACGSEELSVRTWDFRAAEDHEKHVQQLRTARHARKSGSRRRPEAPNPHKHASSSDASAAWLSRSLPANLGAMSFGGRHNPSENTDDEAGPSRASMGVLLRAGPEGGPALHGGLDDRDGGAGMPPESVGRLGTRSGPIGAPGSLSASGAVLPSPPVLRGAPHPESVRLAEMQSWKIVRPRRVMGSADEVSSPVGRCKTVKVVG